jgi:hypothetical protein
MENTGSNLRVIVNRRRLLANAAILAAIFSPTRYDGSGRVPKEAR